MNWDTTEQAFLDALSDDNQAEAERLAALIDAAEEARKARLSAPDSLLTCALYYADKGIRVFPLEPGIGYDNEGKPKGKRPITAHGLNDATIDSDQIRAWWTRTPQANIGTPTGHQFDVIDVDPPDGWTSLAELKAAGLVPEPLGYAHTPRGGMHIYVPVSGDGNATGILPGIDLRGKGGYVVAPPSRCAIGSWEWTTTIPELRP